MEVLKVVDVGPVDLSKYQMVLQYGEYAGQRYDIISYKEENGRGTYLLGKHIQHNKTPLERSIEHRIAQEALHGNLPS